MNIRHQKISTLLQKQRGGRRKDHEEMAPQSARFLCNHWRSRLPTSRPLPTGTYPNSCDHCIHTHAQTRHAAIVFRYLREKNRLEAIIAEKQRISNTNFRDSARFEAHLDELTSVRRQLMAIESAEADEIRAAWNVYNELWPSGWGIP